MLKALKTLRVGTLRTLRTLRVGTLRTLRTLRLLKKKAPLR